MGYLLPSIDELRGRPNEPTHLHKQVLISGQVHGGGEGNILGYVALRPGCV